MRTLVAGPRPIARLAPGMADAPYATLDLAPLSPLIGAEVRGVDLRGPFDGEQLAELRRAFLEWKVLFFRAQDLTGAQLCAFARLWGELEVHPLHEQGELPELVRFDRTGGYENTWHSDVSWRAVPSLGSVLRCCVSPPVGGDTLWADMGAAWDGLDDDVRARCRALRAVHDIAARYDWGMSPDELARFHEEHPPVRHPVMRTHPETGRALLYVNESFVSHLESDDLVAAEGDELLEHLVAQARVPEHQCRFRWEPGSVAFWDNRATQHYAVSDYAPARRVMERATIIGDAPV
jgi:taurine dioxygenase